MKKAILILSVMALTIPSAFAKPHGGHQAPGGHKKPARVVVKHRPPAHQHPHIYRYHHHCMCNNPYCIHRGYFDTFFNITPGISVRVSI